MRIFNFILAILNIVATFAFLFLENRLNAMYIACALLFYFVSSAIHLLLHETGHLIGGAISGYKLLYIQFGPLNLAINKNNKPTIYWKNSISGQCVMIPKQINDIHYIAYNLGGILANSLIVVCSFNLLFFDLFWTRLLFIELLCVGIRKIIMNTVPHKTKTVPNDAYIIKLLKQNTAVKKDYATYLVLYGHLFFDEEISKQDYMYKREPCDNEDEMLYYNEIQDILNSIESNN